MVHLMGYNSKLIQCTGSAVEVIASGTACQGLIFANEGDSPALVSGTGLSVEDAEQFVLVVPESGTVTVDTEFYTPHGIQVTAPVGTTVSLRYGTNRSAAK